MPDLVRELQTSWKPVFTGNIQGLTELNWAQFGCSQAFKINQNSANIQHEIWPKFNLNCVLCAPLFNGLRISFPNGRIPVMASSAKNLCVFLSPSTAISIAGHVVLPHVDLPGTYRWHESQHSIFWTMVWRQQHTGWYRAFWSPFWKDFTRRQCHCKLFFFFQRYVPFILLICFQVLSLYRRFQDRKFLFMGQP